MQLISKIKGKFDVLAVILPFIHRSLGFFCEDILTILLAMYQPYQR
jgi:hypothetical protein